MCEHGDYGTQVQVATGQPHKVVQNICTKQIMKVYLFQSQESRSFTLQCVCVSVCVYSNIYYVLCSCIAVE